MGDQSPIRCPVICGPTAGGKSSLAMSLASLLSTKGIGAEIVSADAYQVYRSMDIGTAKASQEDRRLVPHHMIDIIDPTETFTVNQWLRQAEDAIADIRSRGRVPIVVGGTHLFIKALVDGLFEGPEPDEKIRETLRAMPAGELRAELERVDPASAERLHPNDLRRTIRALEVHRQTGQTISSLQTQWDRDHPRDPDLRLIVLDWPTEAINSRINARVRQMRAMGLTEEARSLHESGRLGQTAGQALGYKQLVSHFVGQCSEDEAYEQIKIETRRFAKNQRTWLRRLRMTPESLSLSPRNQTPEELSQLVYQQVVG